MLLVFVDGVGLGPAAKTNPLTGAMPRLAARLGGALTREHEALDQSQGQRDFVLRSLDACLDVEGLPQSATGQTTLFTGRNGAQAVGRHVTAFPGARLKELLAESSIFKTLREQGRTAAFANAFSPQYEERIKARRLRYSASVLAAMAGSVRLRTLEDLGRGEAVSWDICRDLFARGLDRELPKVGASCAGEHLAAVSAGYQFTLFETFLTDLAGHGRAQPEDALERVDGLLEGVLRERPEELTVVVTSDHGNIEDTSHTRHTRNPVPLLVVGPAADRFGEAGSLLDVVPAILAALEASVP